jgi:NADPH:quinone reductase-like Zn-dependent oxidoreductase
VQALRIHEHGDPSVLRIEDVPRPVPGAGQALVRVLGVSLNHLDLWVRRGMPGFPVAFPRILGCDGTGEVVELGSGVSGLARGDVVVIEPGYSSGNSPEDKAGNDHLSPDYSIRGEHSDGLCCEYVALDARYLLPLPKGIDPVRAAAVPLVFVTAWGLVVSRGAVKAGETVLVLGGASGVGSAAIQIARARGARVFATAGSAEKQGLCLELGAEAALDHRPGSYEGGGWGKEFKKLTGGKGADLVVEHIGPATWKTSMAVLARNGRLVTCGGTTGPIVEIALPHLFIKNQSVLGSTMGPRSAFPEIFAGVASGVFRPVVERVLPLSQAREAHERLESREVVGKLVLVPGR